MEPYLSGERLIIPFEGMEEDFNRIYEGYYSVCRFTVLARVGETWYAAGSDSRNQACLFSSGDGMTWTEMETEASFGSVRLKDYGDIIAIFPGGLADELLLIGSAGVAVTVPDCPYCIEASRFSDGTVSDVKLENRVIHWRMPGGEEMQASLDDLAHHRVSLEWVRKHRAVLIDLRQGEEKERYRLPGAVAVPENLFEAFIRGVPRDAYLALLDDETDEADRAAEQARKAGWANCRSMGSIRKALLTGEE